MAVVRASTQNPSEATVTSLRCNMPAYVAGDPIEMLVWHDSPGETITAIEAGWTPLCPSFTEAGSPSSSFRAFRRIATSSEPADYGAQIGSANANRMSIIIKTINPQGATFLASYVGSPEVNTRVDASGVIDTNAIAAVSNPSLLSATFTTDDNTTVSVAPPGMTLDQHADTTSGEMVSYSQSNPGTPPTSLTKQLTWLSNSERMAFAVLHEFSSASSLALILQQIRHFTRRFR